MLLILRILKLAKFQLQFNVSRIHFWFHRPSLVNRNVISIFFYNTGKCIAHNIMKKIPSFKFYQLPAFSHREQVLYINSVLYNDVFDSV